MATLELPHTKSEQPESLPVKCTWSEWRPFPDPRKGGMLMAPFGPGCYELRYSNGQLVLFGKAGNVAFRMTSLLPPPLGKGARRNMAKRSYVLASIADIEYRTIACCSRAEASEIEHGLKANRMAYVFGEVRALLTG